MTSKLIVASAVSAIIGAIVGCMMMLTSLNMQRQTTVRLDSTYNVTPTSEYVSVGNNNEMLCIMFRDGSGQCFSDTMRTIEVPNIAPPSVAPTPKNSSDIPSAPSF